jgi:hypothetical protein
MRALLAFILLTSAVPAFAADDKAAAKEAYESGRRHYDLGEYDEALTQFKKAYLNYAEPVFLFNIAICYRQLGDNKAAIRSYRAFLDNFPKAPNRASVERMIAELEQAPPATKPEVHAAVTQPPQRATPEPRVNPAQPQTQTQSRTPAQTKSSTAQPQTRQPQTGQPQMAQQQTAQPQSAQPQSAQPQPAPIAKQEPVKSRFDTTEMEEITPNFEQRSGSREKKKVKPWVWWVTGAGILAVLGGATALIVVETRNTSPSTASTFGPTLPDFNAAGAVRFGRGAR